MKLLVQRVTRATVEVDSFVESRIGTGLVLLLALRKGDTAEELHRLATKVAKLQLWPEPMEPDQQWCTTVQDNGFEILVVLQQSLLATFPQLRPEEGSAALGAEEAAALFESFLQALRKEYQEEMVVGAPLNAPSLRVESTMDSAACLFELAGEAPAALPARRPLGAAAAPRSAAPSRPGLEEEAPRQLEPDVGMVTRALQRIPRMSKSKATLEGVRVFRIFSSKRFQEALAESGQAEANAFAEALEAAAPHFSQKQREQITSWTGVELPSEVPAAAAEEDAEQADALPGEDEAAGAVGGSEVDRQLAQLRAEVAGRNAAEAARKRPFPVKAEPAGSTEAARFGSVRPWAPRPTQPSWSGAPATQGGKAFGKGNKGSKGPRGPARQWGIAALDESARMHGGSAGGYSYGQTAAFSERELKFGIRAKQEEPDEEATGGEPEKKRPAVAPRLAKGTPTLAPMTPAPATAADIIEEL